MMNQPQNQELKTPFKTVTLTDANGAAHVYNYQLHGGRSGIRLLNKIIKIASGSLGTLVDSFASAKAAVPVSPTRTVMDADVPLDKIGGALANFAAQLHAEGDDELFSEILKHTLRDGQQVNAIFDSAYQANYLELFSITGYVIWDNFGTSLTGPFRQTITVLAAELFLKIREISSPKSE